MSDVDFLVQTGDGVLHAYVRLDVLLCDLSTNRGEPITLYRRTQSLGRIRFEPCSEAALREIVDHVVSKGSCT